MNSVCVLAFLILCVSHTFAETETIYGNIDGATEVGRETFDVPSNPTKVLSLVHDFELEVSF